MGDLRGGWESFCRLGPLLGLLDQDQLSTCFTIQPLSRIPTASISTPVNFFSSKLQNHTI